MEHNETKKKKKKKKKIVDLYCIAQTVDAASKVLVLFGGMVAIVDCNTDTCKAILYSEYNYVFKLHRDEKPFAAYFTQTIFASLTKKYITR